EGLRRQRADMALERRAFRHHAADHEALEVPGLDRRQRVEARLARLPDEVAIARLAYPEFRHPRAHQRDRSHVTTSSSSLVQEPLREPLARAMRRVQLRGGARGPHARRTLCTLNVRPRAPTKQMGPYHRSRARAR